MGHGADYQFDRIAEDRLWGSSGCSKDPTDWYDSIDSDKYAQKAFEFYED
jgi:hypothetical protein